MARGVLQRFIYETLHHFRVQFGPFNAATQRRWKKPTVTAQTRLQHRTRDLKLDNLMKNLHKLNLILSLTDLMSSRRRGPFVSVQIMSRWANNIVGLNVPIGGFLGKYPHVFHLFPHPIKRNVCCKLTSKMKLLLQEESDVIKTMELDNVKNIKKLLMISVTGTLHIHALRLIKRELGLPDDFRESILAKHTDFELVDLEIVRLIDTDDHEDLKVAQVEKWRENEYKEKWLSEFETKYAFPINFPTGFEIKAGFRGKLKDWQRLPYSKPYEKERASSRQRFEKRAVGILHELLSLTVEKMVEIERLAHFKKDFGIPVNFRELILKHPGIFYISTRGCSQMVFLREAYCKDVVVSPNPVYVVRRKLLDLMLLGSRNTRELTSHRESVCDDDQNQGGVIHDDFVISILEKVDNNDNGTSENREDIGEEDYVFPGLEDDVAGNDLDNDGCKA